MKKICLFVILLGGLLGGAALAQIPANMQPVDTTDGGKSYYPEHQPLPAEIRQLLDEQKAKEAVAEYEKFKKTLEADELDVLFLDAEVYGTASFMESGASYGKMREDAVKKMLEIAPNNVEVLMLTMPLDGDVDKTLEVLNKMIAADSTYMPAYEDRFNIYKEKKMMKEACLDYVKLPASAQERLDTNGVDCKALVEEGEQK